MAINNDREEKFIVPLDGQWMPGVEPALIGKNFRTLTNCRYADGHPESITGMTKVNTDIMNATYFKTRSAFNFNKSQPLENHILVQAFDNSLTSSAILDNTTYIQLYESDLTEDISLADVSGDFNTLVATATSTTLSGATGTITLNIPYIVYIRGVQLRVDTAITGATSWSAAFSGGNTATICTGESIAVNTKVNSYSGGLTSSTTQITLTAAGGSFTGGVVRAIVFYDKMEALTGEQILIAASVENIGGFGQAVNESVSPSLSGSTTTITMNLPSGVYIRGVQLRVDTEVTGAGSWKAAFNGGNSAIICTGGALTLNTKVNSMSGGLTTSITQITLTAETGTFTAGVIRAWVYYDIFDTLADVTATTNFKTTTLFDDSDGADFGIFSYAPNGQMAYCNGVDSCIWAGSEGRCGAFIMSSATLSNPNDTITNPKDFTVQVNNTQQDSANVAVVGGGIDSFTKLMLHMDGTDGSTTFTDSETAGAAKTMTAVGDAQIDTSQYKFGNSSGLFDGTGDYLTTPDHADWYFADQPFTIDFWVRISNIGANHGICGQYVDTNNYWELRIPSPYIYFRVWSGGSIKADYITASSPISSINTWYHVEIGRNGTELYIYVNGISQTLTINNAISTNSVPNLAAELEVGASNNHTYLINGYIDEFRISKGICRHISNFSPNAKAYSTSFLTALIGCTRPAQGIKIYIADGSENKITNTLTVKEFNGTTWNSLTIISDGTRNLADTISYSKTGTISWSSTVTSSQPKFLESNYLYWYQLTVSDGDASIYYCTIDMPFQNIVDLWDGVYRSIAAFYIYKTSDADNTLNVYEDSYDSTDSSTYADVSSLTATTQYLECGFSYKITGLIINIPSDKANSTASTTVSIDYWDGTSYNTVGIISDGTSASSISFARSGVITWTNSNIASEQKKSIAGGYSLYYYRIKFDKNLSASTYIYYVAGIPSATTIKGFSFGLNAANRLMLGCDNYGKRNLLKISATDRPDVWNGDDTYDIEFGDDNQLMAGASIFAQYASNIYNMALIFKMTETWTLTWDQTTTETIWQRYRVSPSIGCPAPRTVVVMSVTFEKNINQTKVVAIWRGEDGIYLSNGQSPLNVSAQISSVFDPFVTTHVNRSMVYREYAFADNLNQEYHWLWASGDNVTLDKEYVLDCVRWQWYEIDRTTGLRLQCGIDVSDTVGNNYTYGFIDTGYMEWLEYGSSFDGVAVTSTMEFGDQLPVPQGLFSMTRVMRSNIVAISKSVSKALSLTHTLDGSTAAGTAYSISMSATNKRYANVMKYMNSPVGIFHSFKLSANTDGLNGDGAFTGGTTNWTFSEVVYTYGTNNILKDADGTGTLVHDNFVAVVGHTYTLTFTLSSVSGGSVTPTLGGTAGSVRSTAATFSESITATTTGGLIFTPENASRFTLDSVTIFSETEHKAMEPIYFGVYYQIEKEHIQN